MVGWPARCRKPPSTTIIIVDDGPYPRMVRRLRLNDGPEALDDAIIPEITLHAEQRNGPMLAEAGRELPLGAARRQRRGLALATIGTAEIPGNGLGPLTFNHRAVGHERDHTSSVSTMVPFLAWSGACGGTTVLKRSTMPSFPKSRSTLSSVPARCSQRPAANSASARAAGSASAKLGAP